MIRCLACSHDNPEGSRFCVQCGKTLAAGVAATAPRRAHRWGVLLPVAVGGMVAAAIALYGFRSAETVQDYWPISPKGRTWEYTGTYTVGSMVWTRNQQVTLVGEQDFEGQKAFLYEVLVVLRRS